MMQTPKNKPLYIPAIVVLMAIFAIAFSPMPTAVAEDSSNNQSSDQSSDDHVYDGKDGKNCADKKKDKSEISSTSGNV